MKNGKTIGILLLLCVFLVGMQATAMAKLTEKQIIDLARARYLAEEYGISQDELLTLSSKGLSWEEISKRLEDVYPHKLPQMGNAQYAELAKSSGLSMLEAMRAYSLAARYRMDPSLIAELAKEAGSVDRLEALLKQRNAAQQYVYGNAKSAKTETDKVNLAISATSMSFGNTGLWLNVNYPKGISAEDVIDTIFLCQLQYQEASEEKQGIFEGLLDDYEAVKQEYGRLRKVWPERKFPENKLTDLREGVPQRVETEGLRASSVEGIPTIVDISEIYNTDKVSPFKSYFESRTETIDPASGALIIKQVDFTLPGRNGLDFSLARAYNSQSATANVPDPEIDITGYDVNDGYNDFADTPVKTVYEDGYEFMTYVIHFVYQTQYSPDGMVDGTAYPGYEVIYYDNDNNYLYDAYFPLDSFLAEMPANPYDMTPRVSIQSNSKATDFFDRRFKFGLGWRLALPTIEVGELNKLYLHMGDGSSYEIGGNYYSGGTDYFLEDYPIMDMRINRDTEYQNGIDAQSSQFRLSTKDGIMYFFSSEGLLLGIKDRFNNEIKIENEGSGKDRHIKRIIDSVGREISFTYYDAYIIVSIKENPQGSVISTWQYNLATVSASLNNRKKLVSVVPPDGLPHSYDYSVSQATYDLVLDGYTVSSGSTQQQFDYLNLMSIWHQTANPGDQASARTIFTYSVDQRGDSNQGPLTQYFRISSRKDELPGSLGIEQNDHCVFTYEPWTSYHPYYQCTKTPQRKSGESGTTPAIEKWQFDDEYRLTKHIIEGTNSGLDRNLLETTQQSYTYAAPLDGSIGKLPTTITTLYQIGSSQRTDTETFTWDVLGNKIKHVDAEGVTHKYQYDSTFSMLTRQVTITQSTNPETGLVAKMTLDQDKKRVTDSETYIGYSSVDNVNKTSYSPYTCPSDIAEASSWYWTTPEPVTEIKYEINWSTNSFFDTAAYKLYYRVSGTTNWTQYQSKTHTMIIGGGSGTDVFTKTNLTLNQYDIRVYVTKSAVGVEAITAKGPTYLWDYPPQGQVTKEKLQYDVNYPWLVSEYSVYKFNDQVNKETCSTFVYGSDKVAPTQIITQVADADGYIGNEITEATYDTLGRVTSTNTYRQGDPNYQNTITAVAYDDLGRTIEAQLPSIPNDQRRSLYIQYDDVNSAVVRTDPANRQTKQTFDKLGRIIKSEWLGSASWYPISTVEYDSLGRMSKSYGATGADSETRYEYDAFGRTIRTTLPKIEPTDTEAERQYSETWYSPVIDSGMFPLNGFPIPPTGLYSIGTNAVYNYVAVRVEKSIALKTGLEQETRTSYTAYDRKDRVIWQAVQTSATPTWNMIWNKYDKLGRLIASWVWVKNVSGVDYWDKTEYEYALHFDKPTLVKLPGMGTPEPYHTYAYDSRGLVIAEDAGTGYQVLTQYDSKGRAKIVQYGNGADTMASKLYYDATGDLTVAKAYTNGLLDNQVNRTYDNRGQLITETWQFDNSTYTIAYEHDNSGNVTKITYPDGTPVDYFYDARNLLTRIPNLFVGSNNSDGFEYDADGRLIGIHSTNSVDTVRSYDGRGRLISTEATYSIDGDVLDLAFNYTSQDNISSIREMTDNLDFTLDFGYDFVSRLTEAEVYGYQDRAKVLYSYDGAGNRLTEVWKDAQNLTVESFNCAYNPGNYLVSRGSEIFETGLYGQITSRTEAGVATTYAYNPMRMMKEASEAGVTLAKYEYDALGRRIISWLDDEWRTVSLWSGNDSIYEIRQEWTTPPPNPPTETITRYVAVNGQYLAKLVGGYNSTQPFFHHTDIVGTVRAVTDIYGAVVARYAYEPFGSLTTASGLVDGELHRFTGKPSDLETELSYFNARYYDPAIGRFTSSDPARDGLNWFVYCNNTPLTNIDADGKKVQAEVDGGAPAGQGGAGGIGSVKVVNVKGNSCYWLLPPFLRGGMIEKILGGMCTNFPVIDVAIEEAGKIVSIVSIKSMDILAKTYSSGSVEIIRAITSMATKLANFAGRAWGTVQVFPTAETERILTVVISDTPSMAVVTAAKDLAEKLGILIRFIVYK